MDQYNDKHLLELIAKSDIAAFEELYARYWKLLFHLVWSKVGNKEDSSDILQEFFTELWDKRNSLAKVGNVKPYLISFLYNKIFFYFRQKGFHEKHIKNFEKYLEQMGVNGVEIPGALEALEKQYDKMQEVVDLSIEMMPEKMKKVFLMKLSGDGVSVDEIATKLNISNSTVKSHLQSAMQRLRKVSEEHALDISVVLLYVSLRALILH